MLLLEIFHLLFMIYYLLFFFHVFVPPWRAPSAPSGPERARSGASGWEASSHAAMHLYLYPQRSLCRGEPGRAQGAEKGGGSEEGKSGLRPRAPLTLLATVLSCVHLLLRRRQHFAVLAPSALLCAARIPAASLSPTLV